jgi:hypothetical protein
MERQDEVLLAPLVWVEDGEVTARDVDQAQTGHSQDVANRLPSQVRSGDGVAYLMYRCQFCGLDWLVGTLKDANHGAQFGIMVVNGDFGSNGAK